ncbi:tripartite tricarboxylate transporter substrate binding protein [Ramlibacter tataouinensis]|uniref:Bug family tripartite tricarboxylate transporter substrate binding protein n=1 Tax=Ramlibacter tataouinensis TaxID=94132 RepID=UPI0022F3C8A8|nr:tripartite tricarboxylate transporter substrate binding protein [Ramlibacter tataouinensis]WBY02777.1 tripartite tricarboxylate transporter substrate binding protein [Ramlibacter tataouinensis]
MNKRSVMLALALMGACTCLPAAAQGAEEYPSRPLKLIITYTPGGVSDITGRVIAQKLEAALGQPVVVENRPGAGGGLGMQQAARSKPDGYTLVLGTGAPLVVAPAVFKTLPYDPLKDFTPVSLIGSAPIVLLSARESSIQSVPDLVRMAKSEPGKLSYGSGSTMLQLSMEMFKAQSGVDMIGVNYKGVVEAAIDVMGGRTTVVPDTIGASMANIRAGKLKPLAVMSPKRSAVLPDVPTFNELGFKDFDVSGWTGILVPAGTPDAIVRRLHAEIAKAVASPEVQQKFLAIGVEPVSNTPQQFAEMLARDTERYAAVARTARIEKQ